MLYENYSGKGFTDMYLGNFVSVIIQRLYHTGRILIKRIKREFRLRIMVF